MTNYIEKRRNRIMNDLLPKQGKGLVNSLIDSLPFEMHLPGGYQYAGPGTNLELKLEKGVKPKNKLDEAAMFHDIAYSKSKNLNDRHVADKKLEEDAWARVKASDAGLGEKAMAWLVTNTMKGKRALGAGIGSTHYTDYPVNLSDTERQKLIKAVTEKKKAVSLTVTKKRTKESIQSGVSLPLTKTQINKIKKSKISATIKLSGAQINKIKTGGFLPALIAAAPAVAAVLGTIYNSYSNKKANDRLIEEKVRHNKVMEGKGLYLNKKPTGKGLYLNKKPTKGNGLYEQLFRKKSTRTK